MDIAAAEFALDVVESEMIAIAMSMQGHPIRACQWQRQVRQVIQIGQILALQLNIRIDRPEVERLGNRAAHLDA